MRLIKLQSVFVSTLESALTTDHTRHLLVELEAQNQMDE